MSEMTIGMSKEDFKEQFPKAVLYGRVFFDPVNYGVIAVKSSKLQLSVNIDKNATRSPAGDYRNKGV